MAAGERAGKAPRVLMVARNFPPLRGGMERLNFHAYRELARDFEVALCGPRGAERYVESHTRLNSSPHKPLWRFLIQCQAQILRSALATRPHLIYSGSGLTALPSVVVGRVLNTPVLTYVHGLDLVVRSPIYQSFFLPAIRACDGVIANSRNTKRLACEAGVDPTRIHLLHPGVEIPIKRKGGNESRFRKVIGADKRPLLLSVGRLTPRKGLVEFIHAALPSILCDCPQVLLVIIGDEAVDAAERHPELMKDKIRSAARAIGAEHSVLLIGGVDDHTLAQAYAESELHIFPALDKPGDVEGFGMVALEAAAHGVPTIAFAVGGVPDAVSEGRSGYLVPAGNYQQFSSVVKQFLMRRLSIKQEICRAFASEFEWSHFGERLREICSVHMGAEAASIARHPYS